VVLTNLQPGRTYSFKAASSDQNGNGPTSSSTLNFTTQTTPDLTGPVFTTAPFASGVSKTQAVIEWDTDEPSTTQIKYGTSSDQLNSQTALPGLANIHGIVLTNLNPGTTYYFRAMSMDSSGNLSESSVGQFATVAPDTTPPDGTITINSGANYTNSTLVTLTLSCSDASGCAHMEFSNDNTVWSTPEDYNTSKMWTLSSGDGLKTVYVKFQDGAGIWSGAFSDSITLQTVAPGVPDISVSPALLALGQVVTGSTSTPQTVTISNTGTANLVISAIDKTGTDAGMFSVATGGPNPCSSLTPTISPGRNCTVNVTFSPTSTLKKTATLSISSDDPDENPVNVSLSGNGVIVKLTRPNGGEPWKSGTIQTITWQTMSAPPKQVAKFRLRRTINGGTTWVTMVTRSGNPGRYDWKVPAVLSIKKRCRIKVILLDSLGSIIGSDVSDRWFTIIP